MIIPVTNAVKNIIVIALAEPYFYSSMGTNNKMKVKLPSK